MYAREKKALFSRQQTNFVGRAPLLTPYRRYENHVLVRAVAALRVAESRLRGAAMGRRAARSAGRNRHEVSLIFNRKQIKNNSFIHLIIRLLKNENRQWPRKNQRP